MQLKATIFLAFLGIGLIPSLSAEKKSQDTITFGQSLTLDGALGIYGRIIQNAIHTRMQRINDAGGIDGKKLKLVSMNDSGDPKKTLDNIEKMRADGIDMFIGNMGTRSILKILPLIESQEIALFFPWSGYEKFRDPKLTHIINGPGLLQTQLDGIGEYIKQNLKIKKIAIFHADDDFSTDGARDLTKMLVDHGITPVATASYNRFTLDIKTPAEKLLDADPKIVICISTSMPAAKLINYFYSNGDYGTTFFGIDSTNFVGDIVKERGAEFYYSSAVPDPTTSAMPIAKQYLDDIKKYYPDEIPNTLSFMYYVCCAILLDAINQIDGPITKTSIINAIEHMQHHNVDGFSVTFDAKNRHALGEKISIIKG
jgi:ABC-type branched-subunit amino acid transport system substrate-binding protein